MTMKEYLMNPMGPGNSSLMLSTTRAALDMQYSQLASRITYKWYGLGDKFLICHIKVPSKSIETLSYDVLIEINVDAIPSGVSVINDAPVKVFSNCPSFTFTYAKVFSEKGLLIDWTRRKYDIKVFSQDPEKRNPSKIINYEKSLYFAFKFILSQGRNYKDKIKLRHTKVKSNIIIYNNVKSSDEILRGYDERRKKVKPEVKKEKSKQAVSLPPKKDNKPKNGIKSISSVKKIKGLKNKVKKTKKI